MWIDYTKSYDSVPYSWLITALKLYKINTHTIKFITHTMKKRRTRIFLPHKNGCIESTDITFLRGICQGDAFLPLIFCIRLALIKNVIKRNDVGYKIMNEKVNNLMYIDDLEVYFKHAVKMER